MPTVLVVGPYRFFFYSSDGNEARHIHVERDHNVAKFWLDTVVLEQSGGFSRREINRVYMLVDEHQGELINAWDRYFGA